MKFRKKKSRKPPRFAIWLLNKMSRYEEKYSILNDVEEVYYTIIEQKGFLRAYIWYWYQTVLSFFKYVNLSVIWSFIMFKNYLKSAVRNLLKQKGYSFINIFGLAVGLTSCIFILLYVRYELSYDSHHKDVNSIYRIVADFNSPGFRFKSGVHIPLAPYVKEKLPQVRTAAWMWMHHIDSQVKVEDKLYCEKNIHVICADPDFLKIFSADFRYGDPNIALSNPNSVVISVKTAKKYFGSENALNKTITVDSTSYTVSGVIEELPGNSIFKFKMLKSWDIIRDPFAPINECERIGGTNQTFVKLKPGADKEQLKFLVKELLFNGLYKDYLKNNSGELSIELQPLKSIHLSRDIKLANDDTGSILYIYLFSAIAVFILIITCTNFMNLSTARSASRACEVGIRKAVGAHRRQLICQFMGDTFFTVIIACVTAFVMVISMLTEFNKITNLRIEYSAIFDPDVILIVLLLFFTVGIFSGLYPAFFLSSFKPVLVLKGTLSKGVKNIRLRRVLVIIQFTLSAVIFIVSLIFNMQLHFMKNKPLGFNKEQLLVIDFQRNYESDHKKAKEEFLKFPGVLGASFSISIPGRWLYPWDVWPAGRKNTNSHKVQVLGADKDFLSLYNIDLIAGENFSKGQNFRAWILNEKAVRTFGWNKPEDALNKIFGEEHPAKIAGVIRDFHFTGLQKEIDPLVIFHASKGLYLTLKIDTRNLNTTMMLIKNKFKSMFPDKYFNYFFLNDDFNRHYFKEEQMSKIFNLFTILGIFIAGLGLLGLSSFIVSQKTKEIGIRKVLGASTGKITSMLTGQFVRWIILANVIACPAAYFIVKKILEDFAYRINPGVELYIFSIILTLFVALIAVGFQSVKAANANPVESLKYE